MSDRLSESAKAKQAMLEKFRARPAQDDPELVARRAEQAARAKARDERRELAELMRQERADAERKAKEDEKRRAEEAAEEARYAEQAAADLARAQFEAEQRAVLAKQRTALEGWERARKRGAR